MAYQVTFIKKLFTTDIEKEAYKQFIRLIKTTEENKLVQHGFALADILGNRGELEKFFDGNSNSINNLIKSFRDNIELLLHKTWVENPEEHPRKLMLDELKQFETDFKNGKTASAFIRIISLSNFIAKLLFGHLSTDEDFLEYCFRIDPKFGLFFWYISELEKQAHQNDTAISNKLKNIEVIIALYVLSCF